MRVNFCSGQFLSSSLSYSSSSSSSSSRKRQFLITTIFYVINKDNNKKKSVTTKHIYRYIYNINMFFLFVSFRLHNYELGLRLSLGRMPRKSTMS